MNFTRSIYVVAFLLPALIPPPAAMSARGWPQAPDRGYEHGRNANDTRPRSSDNITMGATSSGESWDEMKQRSTEHPLQVAGSRLPDCSHACGSCRPCRLVIVSLVCASLAEAETCPISYRCMCNSKSYPVP